jgi:hypothetical protein
MTRLRSVLAAASQPFTKGPHMFSADQDLGPGVGPWHPHMMLYTPYYENSMLGGNQVGGAPPFVGDDTGTPFAVTVIPVAH